MFRGQSSAAKTRSPPLGWLTKRRSRRNKKARLGSRSAGGIIFHRHAPVRTGVIIQAGFRKENLPRGAWLFLCTGEMWECRCRQKWIEVKECCGRAQLVELEGMEQYDRYRTN